MTPQSSIPSPLDGLNATVAIYDVRTLKARFRAEDGSPRTWTPEPPRLGFAPAERLRHQGMTFVLTEAGTNQHNTHWLDFGGSPTTHVAGDNLRALDCDTYADALDSIADLIGVAPGAIDVHKLELSRILDLDDPAHVRDLDRAGANDFASWPRDDAKLGATARAETLHKSGRLEVRHRTKVYINDDGRLKLERKYQVCRLPGSFLKLISTPHTKGAPRTRVTFATLAEALRSTPHTVAEGAHTILKRVAREVTYQGPDAEALHTALVAAVDQFRYSTRSADDAPEHGPAEALNRDTETPVRTGVLTEVTDAPLLGTPAPKGTRDPLSPLPTQPLTHDIHDPQHIGDKDLRQPTEQTEPTSPVPAGTATSGAPLDLDALTPEQEETLFKTLLSRRTYAQVAQVLDDLLDEAEAARLAKAAPQGRTATGAPEVADDDDTLDLDLDTAQQAPQDAFTARLSDPQAQPGPQGRRAVTEALEPKPSTPTPPRPIYRTDANGRDHAWADYNLDPADLIEWEAEHRLPELETLTL